MSKTLDPSLVSPHVVAEEMSYRYANDLAAALMADGSDLGECADDLRRALKASNLILARNPRP